jgi:quercetin dioxygenase-like cupin family protein
MSSRNLIYVLLFSLFTFVAEVALTQAADAPKDNKGHTASKTTVVELGPEFPGMDGRQLRFRLLTIEPGGHIGLHNHKERAAVVYFLQGTDAVIRDDGTKPGTY